MEIKHLDEMITYAGKFLEKNSADGSDPGLCVAVAENLKDKERLVKFGIDATKSVLTKNDAITLASELNIHLSEHGGTGGGIIGALSGVGLRIYGNNGRFKGWLPISNNTITVQRLIDEYDIDEVRDITGDTPGMDDIITLDEKVKTVLLDGLSVLPVKKADGGTQGRVNLSKDEIRKY
jgi:hypothetical protein